MSVSKKLNFSRRQLVAAAGALVAAIPGSALAQGHSPPPRPAEDCLHGGHHGLNCLLSGTRLLTPAGERTIESLAIGDLLVSRSGDVKAIRWIGRRTISRTADENWPTGTTPIRVAQGALGDNVPARDVYLSPSHAVFVDGVLVPVDNLVNGITIVRTEAEGLATLAYFHVELEGHDVVLADGLPVETLLVSAGIAFDNLAERGAAIAAMTPCAPNVGLKGGRDVVRSRLRSAMAPWLDRRQPFDVIRDRLEERAELAKAA